MATEAEIVKLYEVIEAIKAENAVLREWCRFILANHDKFTEHDPDGVKEYALANIADALAMYAEKRG